MCEADDQFVSCFIDETAILLETVCWLELNLVARSQGGRFAGYGLFVKDGKLVYHYNLAGVERFNIESDKPLPKGKVKLQAVYKTDADKPFAGADVTLFAGDEQIGKGRVEKSIPNRVTLDETLDIGFDTGTPVTDSYQTPFKFTGQLSSVTIDLN